MFRASACIFHWFSHSCGRSSVRQQLQELSSVTQGSLSVVCPLDLQLYEEYHDLRPLATLFSLVVSVSFCFVFNCRGLGI
jgi:hypothetical protein